MFATDITPPTPVGQTALSQAEKQCTGTPSVTDTGHSPDAGPRPSSESASAPSNMATNSEDTESGPSSSASVPSTADIGNLLSPSMSVAEICQIVSNLRDILCYSIMWSNHPYCRVHFPMDATESLILVGWGNIHG